MTAIPSVLREFVGYRQKLVLMVDLNQHLEAGWVVLAVVPFSETEQVYNTMFTPEDAQREAAGHTRSPTTDLREHLVVLRNWFLIGRDREHGQPWAELEAKLVATEANLASAHAQVKARDGRVMELSALKDKAESDARSRAQEVTQLSNGLATAQAKTGAAEAQLKVALAEIAGLKALLAEHERVEAAARELTGGQAMRRFGGEQ